MDPEDPDLGSYMRRYGEEFHGPRDADITENRNFIEQKRLEDAVRNATPAALRTGRDLFRGPLPRPARTEDEIRRTDFTQGSVRRSPRQPFFPEEEVAATTQISTGRFPNVAFILSDASETVSGSTTHKIHVFDGKINGEFPSGMGFGDYVLTPSDPGDGIVSAGLTFNPTTLEITSRFLEVDAAADVPESRAESATSGFLYWQLGFCYLDGDAFKIVVTRLGDINFSFSYGAFNGMPALLPIDSGPGWIDLAFV